MSTISKVVKRLGPWGLYRLAQIITRNEPKILMYHRFSELGSTCTVGVKSFEQQLQYINKHFQPRTVAQLAEDVYEKKKLVPNTIAITIDDGYQDFYHYAYPLLKKYNIPATLYITTGFIENKGLLWPDKVSFLLDNVVPPRTEFRFGSFKLEGGYISEEKKAENWHDLINYLLSVEDTKKNDCISSLADSWDITLPNVAPEQYKPCTIEQLLEMQANGIEIGGHTINHPSLSKLSKKEVKQEVLGCENWLKQNLSKQIRSFCYPNGKKDDYNDHVKHIVEYESEFNCAVAAFSDSLGVSDRYAIRRHGGSNQLSNFKSVISGIELINHKVRRLVIK